MAEAVVRSVRSIEKFNDKTVSAQVKGVDHSL